MSFNTQAKLKGRGHVLMTKFGKDGKPGLSGLPNRSIWFWQFQSKTKERSKLKDLKIQGVLKIDNRLNGIKDQDKRKSSKKPKLQKPYHPVCQTKLFGFSRTDRI
jgi:hypothetical protein